MKICPSCNKTYDDDSLNFCLDDGSSLNSVPVQGSPSDAPPDTLVMDSPVPTDPDAPAPTQPSFPEQQTWDSPKPVPPKKKSRAWLWVLGILVGVTVICGGGLTVIVISSMYDQSANVGTASNSERSRFDEILENGSMDGFDLSQCADYSSQDAEVAYENDECILATKKRGYFYVIVFARANETDDATTRIVVRNTREKKTRLGFGLVFHSALTPLKQGYAFLIDSEGRRYRVAKHRNNVESEVIGWKRSDLIKSGTQKNVLEVRAANAKIDLYINGQFVESFKDEFGYQGGVPGIYSGDAIPVAFSGLEISE